MALASNSNDLFSTVMKYMLKELIESMVRIASGVPYVSADYVFQNMALTYTTTIGPSAASLWRFRRTFINLIPR